jgi:hypothetical protein
MVVLPVTFSVSMEQSYLVSEYILGVVPEKNGNLGVRAKNPYGIITINGKIMVILIAVLKLSARPSD